MRILTESMEKPIQRMMPGYLDDLHYSMMNRDENLPFGSPSASEALVIKAVNDAKTPIASTCIGWLLYGMGLVGGYYGGNFVAGKADKYLFDGAAEKREDAAKNASDTAAAAYIGAADMLFKNVSFPLMTNFLTDKAASAAANIPVPTNVLKSAAVKGGLVLGVSITFNLPEEP